MASLRAELGRSLKKGFGVIFAPDFRDPFDAAARGYSMIDFLLIQAANTRNPLWLLRLDYTIVQRVVGAGFRSISEIEALSDAELSTRLPGFGEREIQAIRRATRPDEFGRPAVNIRGDQLK